MKKKLLTCITALITAYMLCAPAKAYTASGPGRTPTVSAGDKHALAIKSDGSLWVWGDGGTGQMGMGEKDERGPRGIPQKLMEDVIAVGAGEGHALALKSDGTLWAWGENTYGQLGIGDGKTNQFKTYGMILNGRDGRYTVPYQDVPVQVMSGVAAISAGSTHSLALKKDGTLWAWGSNGTGEIGNGQTGAKRQALPYREAAYYAPLPQQIMDGVTAISAGDETSFAIKEDHSLWGWGNNDHGQLGGPGAWSGKGGEGLGTSVTTPVHLLDDVAAVCPEDNETFVIKLDGTLWSWRDGKWGRMSNGQQGYIYTLTKHMDDVVDFCGHRGSYLAVKSDHTLWGWGVNSDGQLGNGCEGGRVEDYYVSDGAGGEVYGGQHIWQTTPVKLMEDVETVCGSVHYTLIVKRDGTLWGCGNGNAGTLPYQQYDAPGYDKNLEYERRTGKSLMLTLAYPVQIMEDVKLPGSSNAQPDAPSSPDGSSEGLWPQMTGTAYPSTQKVDVDGKSIELQCYALKDAAGNDTNYIKLRDLADILNGSSAQFQVGWNGQVTITTKTDYTPDGTEQNTPFSGQREYQEVTAPTLVDGKVADLAAFTLTDDNGGGYTYYKLRDLGGALGFKVDWTAQRGIFIETK